MQRCKSNLSLHLGTLGVLLFSLLTSACSTAQIEEPAFTRTMSEKSFEIREYASRMVAQTRVNGSQKEAANQAFSVLADYIFGNNTSQSKIAMTAPVSQENRSEKIAMTAPVSQARNSEGSASADRANSWLVQFTMPSEYTMETLPTPNNDAVELVELPAARYVVMSFSGRANPSQVETKTLDLQTFMADKGLTPIGAVVLAQYNPPWIPGPFRRNEVMMQIGTAK